MPGQRFENARRVILLVETNDRRYGWEIIGPNRVSWEMTGLVKGSTHAEVRASGEFHRITHDAPEFDELDEPSPDAAALPASAREIGRARE